jgi:hypothetical protein
VKDDLFSELLLTREFKEDWQAHEMAIAKENLQKVKLKAIDILARHRSRAGNDKQPKSKRTQMKVREWSNRLYYSELRDTCKSIAVDFTTMEDVATKMTNECLHPNALAALCKNRPRRRAEFIITSLEKAFPSIVGAAIIAGIVAIHALFEAFPVLDEITTTLGSIVRYAIFALIATMFGFAFLSWGMERLGIDKRLGLDEKVTHRTQKILLACFSILFLAAWLAMTWVAMALTGWF